MQRFREPFWIEDGSGDARAYYRPLTVLSFALDHSLHGENPAGYHLTNSALHTLNALLLLTLLLRRRADVRVALLLSAAWALHPRLTEAAGWVSGRTDVLATTFCFLALLVHRSRSLGHSLASAGLLFLGLASKEVALAGVAALMAKELCWRAPGSREAGAWKRGLVFALPLLGALLAYGGLRLSALSGTKPLIVPLSLGERLAAVVEALGRYAFDLAVPWLPRAQQGKLGQPDYRFVALALIAASVATGTVAWRRRASSRRPAPVATEVDLPNRVELAHARRRQPGVGRALGSHLDRGRHRGSLFVSAARGGRALASPSAHRGSATPSAAFGAFVWLYVDAGRRHVASFGRMAE